MTFFLAILASFLNFLFVTDLSVFPFSSSLTQSQGMARNWFLLKKTKRKHWNTQTNPAARTVRKMLALTLAITAGNTVLQGLILVSLPSASVLSEICLSRALSFFLFSDPLSNSGISLRYPATFTASFQFQLPDVSHLPWAAAHPFLHQLLLSASPPFSSPSVSLLPWSF